ncbi:D-isomer specific 2-hydroxyacid dehydrogenase [Emericellopsis atlantica]|uniref:D-isomer specific 2-hydroxyacid dehydrogenase n=1 Tax=Emericellopsis atlantica TaxID=2614577 RepID=A0A9P8CPI9_9HYPO|nr:D-isomer specific 2-hydroxyacid dehydrogenase [Emericellopsis atlantica]KAG9254175.1 D-isomer specific 2-hydroxyacid dehydrogenase [Emericellopsis atlantica]
MQPSSSPDASDAAAKRAFACERCSRRKQRCDRTIPLCAPCRLARALCRSSSREEAVIQGKDSEVTRKGYVTLLLEQIAAVEAQLEAETTQQQQQQQQQSPSPAASDSDALAPPPTSMNMSFLSLSAMAEPCTRDGEFLKQLSISRLIAGVTETYGGNPETASRVGSLWDGIASYLRHPAGATQRLHIARDEADKALRTYLDVVDFRFPRLPVAKVQRGIEAIAAPDEARYRQTLARDPAHIFMAYAVIAIVPLVSDSYPISQGSWVSVHLLGKSLKVLDRVFHQEDGVDIVQCLQLLVILAIHCSTAGSAWHLIGFAMNKCIALGYHREDPKTVLSIPHTELLQRRWAFWGCYLLDVLICAALGRPLSIDASYITTPVPDAMADDVEQDTALFARDSQAPSSVQGNDSMSPQESHHVHLFRYAMLLASVISDTPSSTTRPSRGTASDFEHFLGRALHWRTSGPPHDDPLVRSSYLFQTSLYNTLVLRISVRELLAGFDFDDASSDGLAACFRHWPADGWVVEQRRVSRLKLPSICTAVARSLNRTRMSGRSYLSLLTGYSAVTMALACLYCLAVRIRLLAAGGQNSGSQGTARADSLHFSPAAFGASLYESPGQAWPAFNNPRTWRSAGTGGSQDHVVLSDEYGQLDMMLGIAISKLDVVGRQFPRIHEYRTIVLNIRSFLVALSKQQMGELDESLQDHIDAVTSCAKDVGPIHLQQLTAAVVHVSTWKELNDAIHVNFPQPSMSPILSNTPPSTGQPAPKPQLYILSDFHPEAVRYAQSLFDCVLYGDPQGDEWRSRATAILIKDYYITDDDLAAAPQLRVIGKQGVGLDKVDVEACRRRNVQICNTPGVNAGAVAEMALCLALSVAREVPQMVLRQRVQGEAVRKETVAGLLLSRKVIGVVGMGHIGQAVARMFVGGLQAKIIAFDPYFPQEGGGAWDQIPHQRVDDLDELLAAADVVTLHVPLTDATRDMISAPQLRWMKKTAILINTARGGIVNEDDLAEALEQGWIWGAGFDCHVQEPPTLERYERLWSSPRFVGTPHIAAATDETQIATINGAIDGVYQFVQTKCNGKTAARP